MYTSIQSSQTRAQRVPYTRLGYCCRSLPDRHTPPRVAVPTWILCRCDCTKRSEEKKRRLMKMYCRLLESRKKCRVRGEGRLGAAPRSRIQYRRKLLTKVRHLDGPTQCGHVTYPEKRCSQSPYGTDLTQVDTDRYAIDTDRYIPRQTFATSDDVHHVSSLCIIRLNQSRACSRPLLESFQKTKYVLRRISGEMVDPLCPAATATQ